ncbi:GNVR domain-containing protein, partial [Shewanella sp. CG_4_10_14_0_8_um_filter_42_13]|uniref:GumC family protein n=1 Tax=Shewanella sp. CG_4_10_14_0_8_um_filter_42_13 TaxID=1975534 RepID=UPI000CAC50DA
MENFTEVNGSQDSVNIRQELEKYLAHWRWFVMTIVLGLVIAFLYLRYTTPQYTASATIMIKDNQKSGISDELKAVADLGIVGTGSANNIDNEIHIIKSRKIIGRVVDSLNLTVRYFFEGRVRTMELYDNLDYTVQFVKNDSLYQKINTTFRILKLDQNRFELTSFEGESIIKGVFREVIETPEFGKFTIIAENPNIPIEREVIVSISPRNAVIDSYQSKINVTAVDKLSSVLNLSMTDPIKKKAEDILDELVEQYNRDAIADKNMVSNKTKDFIEERLYTVGLELASIQDNFKDYKDKFGIAGLTEEGTLALEEVSSSNAKTLELRTQLTLAEWVQQEIKKSTKMEILPANLGFSDAITSESITKYNELVLEKYRLEPIAGTKNPNLIALNNEIAVLKQNLQSNLANLKKSIEIQLTKVATESNRVQGKVAMLPLIERGIIDIERQKIIYSELYSYLLKKKEETAISLAITVPNAKIIDTAYSNNIPVSPKGKIIYLAALLLGVVIPFLIIYVKNLLDTKIH